MSDKLPQGRAFKQADKDKTVKRATSKRLAALQKEWVGDSELTAAELLQKQRDLRAAMYERHPELRAA